MRLDKFLKVSRLIKRRSVANDACDAGRVMLNDKVAKAGTEVKAGDVIAVVDKSKENGRFKLVKEEGVYGNAPKWLEVDAEKLTAKVVALPTREDIDYPVEEHLIVEFYSR